jgi:hypothetical protein
MPPVSKERTQALLEKLSELPAEKFDQVEDFVDFLRQRHEDRALADWSMRLSEPVLREIWDNPADAAYDQL